MELEKQGQSEIAGPSETGTGSAKDEKEKLSQIIDMVNQRFQTEFDVQDLVDAVIGDMVGDDAMRQAAAANTRDCTCSPVS